MSDDLLNQLLLARGIETPEQREKFLTPSYLRDIYDAFLLKDMEKVVARILLAIKNSEKIIIFSDYDADGVPGAVILSEFFKKINYTNLEVYIPNRHTESYGLSEKSIQEFADNGAKLVITIDCGITDFTEVKLANKLNLDVIITDHHLPPETLPEAYAIINPKQLGDTYPDKMLCGSGVIFKVVQALIRRGEFNLDKNWEKTLLDLVAIATISDRVPLTDENRALAKFGLLMLQRSRRPGLRALFSAAKLKQENLNEDDVGFTIGPRINSAGRMSHASEAFFLLTTSNIAEAQEMAKHLEKKNGERKKSVEKIMETCEARLSAIAEADLPAVIVIGDESWSPGVLGLGASRLVENKYQRPVFVWGANGNEIKGSCRSDGSVNLVDLMREAGGEQFFTAFGGHAMAGGFSISPEKVGELEERLLKAYEKIEKIKKPEQVEPDAVISIDDVSEYAWHLLEQLAPFGTGNPKPVFSLPNLEIAQAKTFGNGGIHLELGFQKSSGAIICAIGFFTALDKFKNVKLEVGNRINLTATLEKSYFKRQPELRLRIVDITA
ncbi:MAG: single-stranded-DNA-specific exonuclease RecJ [Patescibacteria group bacterium]